MAACTGFVTEQQCLMLSNGDGEHRCQWELTRSADYDCSLLWPTTSTEEPWMNAKQENEAKSQPKPKGKGADIMLLFGGETVDEEAMNNKHSTISLSTVLSLIIAAFAVQQLYLWRVLKKDGYIGLEEE